MNVHIVSLFATSLDTICFLPSTAMEALEGYESESGEGDVGKAFKANDPPMTIKRQSVAPDVQPNKGLVPIRQGGEVVPTRKEEIQHVQGDPL